MEVFDKKHTQNTLRSLHNQGIEMTPEQLKEERTVIFGLIREQMIIKGHKEFQTMTDKAIFLFLKKALDNQE